MTTDYRKITLELSEYDALWLLALTIKNTYAASTPWRPYWKHLAHNIEQNIEQAHSGCIFPSSPTTDRVTAVLDDQRDADDHAT